MDVAHVGDNSAVSCCASQRACGGGTGNRVDQVLEPGRIEGLVFSHSDSVEREKTETALVLQGIRRISVHQSITEKGPPFVSASESLFLKRADALLI